MSLMSKNLKLEVLSGLFWKMSERIGAQGITFIVSIVLARLLTPEDYGLVSLLTIFISISNILVQSGFGNALIQKKDADNIDFSTIFYFNILMSFLFYILLYYLAPYIANFYNKTELIPILRVLSFSVIISAVNNLQHAYISKTMQFKRFFYSTIIGTIISAIVGIYLAYKGLGAWSLVIQQLTNLSMDTLILWFTVKWRPDKVFSYHRLKKLFSFGWKLLISGLIDALYNNIYGLFIGKIYNSSILGLYNRGNQFPNMIVSNVNAPIQNVLLPALSEVQDNREKLKSMVRRSVTISSYLIFPMMIGMASVATPLVNIVLTEKWSGCIIFLQIACITMAFWPIHTTNLQAINAIGRSDIFLKLEIIKKIIGIGILIITIPFGIYFMAIGSAFTSIISSFINAYPNKKLLNYSFIEQWKDITPSLIISLLMGVMVKSIELLNFNNYLTLCIQIPVGIFIYIILSYIFKIESLNYILNILKGLIFKKKDKLRVIS